MKKYFSISTFSSSAFLLLCAVVLVCNNFQAQTANITEGCAPLTVSFTAPSGSTTYLWDFKDGASANTQNPNNTFANQGTYNVTFKETANGPVIGTITIRVHNKPIPTFTTAGPTKGCLPLAVQFTGTTNLPGNVTLTSYSWAFGDGSSANGANVSHTYTSVGTYSVSIGIITSTPSCNTTVIYTDTIGVSNPVASFKTTPNPAVACVAPLNLKLIDASSSPISLTYFWDFGNGNTSTLQNPPNQIYPSDGTYTAILTITDTNNCVKTFQAPILVGSPKAAFNLVDTICINKAINAINSSSPGNYLWTFDAGTSIPSSTLAQPTFSYLTPGNHTVKLEVTAASGGCKDDTTTTIVVEDPTITVSALPNPVCDTNFILNYTVNTTATIVKYDWIFDDGTTSTLANPAKQYRVPDSTYYRRGKYYLFSGEVSVTTAGGCVVTKTFTDTTFYVFARFMPDVSDGCGPLQVEFSDSTKSRFPIINYHYDYGDGTSANLTSNAPHTHTFNNPGKYPVVMTATNNQGCEDISDTIWISVGRTLNLNFGASPLEICPKDVVTFTNLSSDLALADGWHYQTDGENLSSCFDSPNGAFVFDNEVGTFDVSLTASYNGCYTTFTKADYITVKGSIAKFNWKYNCSDTMSIELINQSMGYTSSQWDFGNGVTSNDIDIVYEYPSTGAYMVKLITDNSTSGCPTSIDSSEIFIRKIEAKFNTDTLYCGFTKYPFDASNSVDVYENCYTGYKWIYSDTNLRPITTDNALVDLEFEDSGNQFISLVVKDENGCTDTLTHQIRVFNVNAKYTLQDSRICTPNSLNFNDLSLSDTTLVGWNWDFKDGGNSVLQNTSHNFTVPNYTQGYDILLTVTDAHGCSDTAVRKLSFYKPVSTISSLPTPAQICTNQNIQFTASDFTSEGSNLSYSWDFGEGTSATGQTVSHQFPRDTTLNVKVVYTETATGCIDSTTTLVDIQGYPNALYDTDVDNAPALCSPQIINFQNQSTGTSPVTSSTWTFSNGFNSTNTNPAFVFTTGTYTGQLIVSTSYGCRDTFNRSFTVIGPRGDFTLDTNLICQGDPIVFTLKDTSDVGGWLWDFGDGSDIANVNPVEHKYFFVPPSGQTKAKLTVYGANGVCPYTIEKDVFIREVKADFDRFDELDTVICLGETYSFKNTSLNSDAFEWDFGNGATSTSGDININQNYTVADTFLVTLKVFNSQYGCRDTIEKFIVVNALPVFKALGDTVCEGTPGMLNIGGWKPQFKALWTPADDLSSDTTKNPAVNSSATTVYYVTITDTITTCKDTDSAIAFVIKEYGNTTFDTIIVVGDYVTLPIDNLNGLLNFNWTPDSLLSCYQCSNPTHQGLNEIVFTNQINDLAGCFDATATFKIRIFPETFVDLPSTFTPNGDGVNDIIYLKGWGIKEVIYFRIFNRWGEMVFETDNINQGWDGYYKGILQNNDTYTYNAKVKTFRNETNEGQGHINLMR